MRLDQFLSARTMFTRKELRQLIQKGKVTQNGIVVRKPDTAVMAADQIALNGTEVPNTEYLYLLVNKPVGYVCSANEPGQKLVLELVPPTLCRKNLQPVGRLDKDSTGMLLLTDDGQFAHQLISTRSHSPKYYHVTLARPWEEGYAAAIAAGITLKDGTQCKPAYAESVPEHPYEMRICLHEGKYHQVRRMMASLGNHVSELSRIAIGGMSLPADLPIGGCLVLQAQDVQKILKKENDFATMLQILRKSS